MDSVITRFYGNESVESVDILNTKTNESVNFKTNGVFIFIGYLPNTENLKEKVNLNNHGEIIVSNDMSTNTRGVFAAGDSVAKKYRQITTAVSDGTIAALAAADFINNQKRKKS